MKLIRCFFVICAITFTGTIDVNAQAVAKAGKLVKALVKSSSKSTRKLNPIHTYKIKQIVSKKSIVYVECETCKGKGTVYIWNQYYGYWQSQRCGNCNGMGRIKSYQ